MNIKNIVLGLSKKHKTCNPFEIAKSMNICILYEDLGEIYGYYNNPLRMRQIHINSNLPDHLQTLTCAHELGHALLHPRSNTPFLKKSTFISVDKMEIQANKFAVELLIPDSIILEHQDYTISQFSMMFGYSEELIKLRVTKQ